MFHLAPQATCLKTASVVLASPSEASDEQNSQSSVENSASSAEKAERQPSGDAGLAAETPSIAQVPRSPRPQRGSQAGRAPVGAGGRVRGTIERCFVILSCFLVGRLELLCLPLAGGGSIPLCPAPGAGAAGKGETRAGVGRGRVLSSVILFPQKQCLLSGIPSPSPRAGAIRPPSPQTPDKMIFKDVLQLTRHPMPRPLSGASPLVRICAGSVQKQEDGGGMAGERGIGATPRVQVPAL